jgi:hypothetical protein
VLGIFVHTCPPNYLGKVNRRIAVQAISEIKCDLISKITNARRTGAWLKD